MLKWFLRDRSLDVDEAVEKLREVTAWRQQTRPDALSEDDVFHQISTGKGYLHDQLDIAGRPVVVVRGRQTLPTGKATFALKSNRASKPPEL